MFIKLTKFDNRPIWLNASFIVTVEPRREGSGAVVVPIGDGLDYDVRESPEEVLRLLEGAPAPTVVPVPVSDCLAPTPPDVSPEPLPMEKPPETEAPAAEATAKPKRRTRSKGTGRKAKEAPQPQEEPPPQPKLELSPDEVGRLRKMAPKSLGKLKNTLATQFRIADVGANVAALTQDGVLSIEGNRVSWKAEVADW